jgi:peptidyl-prolyl cis-trans isomerase B (cyclophilin B)
MRFLSCALLALTLISPAFAAEPRVELKTNRGSIVVELYPGKAPQSVANFLRYVRDGFYAGTQFHRVIDGFMIQGGGYDREFRQKQARTPIQNEAEIGFKAGLKNEVGTLAMARTSNPHSATAQFFINVANNAGLDYPAQDGFGYAVFGKVVSGMEVVDKIAKDMTGPGGPFQSNVPREPVIIESATLLPAK